MPDHDDFFTEPELELMELLRSLEPADAELHAPPPDVWAGIEQALASDPAPTILEPQRAAPASRRPSHRRRRFALIGVAAAVTLGAAGAAIAIVRSDGRQVPVAEAPLSSDGLPGAPIGLRGQATVVESGRRDVLRLEIGELTAPSGEYLEVWLIKPDISGMVSLGTVRPDGSYDVPVGLQLADYPIVDISAEPYDGSPAHSGNSLLRGELTL
jgi:anti-sigma-K factor RskA